MRSRAHAVVHWHSLHPGMADPMSWFRSLTWGIAGNALAPLGQGLRSVLKMTPRGTGSLPCQRPPYPSTGAAAEEQHLSLQLSSIAWSQFPGKLLSLHRKPGFRQDYGHG